MFCGKQGPTQHTEIVYKMSIFLLLLFANKSKTKTWKKLKQKHGFLYKLYGFCCCAYQNKQKKNRVFFVMLGPWWKKSPCDKNNNKNNGSKIF
jgi:hypothetical protein